MTPHELIQLLVNQQGPCMRFCSYCPENFVTKDVKDCVEGMYEQIYKLQQDKDMLLEDLIKIRKAYKDVTGFEYQDS